MGEWKYEETLRQAVPPADPRRVRAVRARARARAEARHHRRSRWWLAVPAVAAVAAVLVILQEPAEDLPPPEPVVALDQARTLEPVPGITVEARGRGAVGATEAHWTEGVLQVEVDPARDLNFTVNTDEARVRVVGTVFSVGRDALGTTVDVDRGRVEVTCRGEDRVHLEARQSHLCPRSAAAALGWALRQRQEGSPSSDVLRAVRRGLEQPGGDPAVREELEVLRIQVLAHLGRSERALEQAESWLARGSAGDRASEVRQIAAREALAVGGCERAREHLEALVDSGAGVPLVLLADCVAAEDPERARRLLEQALDRAPPEQHEALRARIDRLGSPGEEGP